MPVSGFICKLCRVFYTKDDRLKADHCKTEKHFVRYQVRLYENNNNNNN